MTRLSFLLAAMALFASAQLLGNTPAVGDQAPAIEGENWIVNEPATSDLEKLRGEVIFIEIWGID